MRAGRGREGRREERERERRGRGRNGEGGGGRVAPKVKLGPSRTIFLAPALKGWPG